MTDLSPLGMDLGEFMLEEDIAFFNQLSQMSSVPLPMPSDGL